MLTKMKLTIFLICITVLGGFAADSYAQTARLTLDAENATIKSILSKIESQSEFKFFYSSNVDVEQTASVSQQNKKVFDILDDLFEGTGIKYEVYGRQIALLEKGENFTFPTETAAQQKAVSGKVIDNTGLPLPGVSVIIKGTTQGTVTNADGEYTLSGISENTTLQFSFVGMLAHEIVVGNQTNINVTMEEETIGLEEVVAVGYGVKKKVNLTGSLASVGSDKLESITTSNFVNGLAGKLPGLRVTQRSGETGSYSTAFDIRGLGSPLIIVDGIKRDDFTRIDPMDIEEITILKDGSAAIYGVEAANGVVLVTTKKGNIGKPVINYSSTYDFQKFTVDPEVTNAYQYAVLTVENEIARGQNPNSTTYSPDDLQKFKDGTYPSTDWLGTIQKDYTSVMHHNINISGGNERVKYYTSLGYLDEGGIWKSNNLYYKKYNLRSSISVDLTENLKAQLNMEGMMEDRNNTSLSADNIYFTAMLAQPTTPLYANDNPDYLHLVNPENVLADISSEHSGYHRTNTKTFQSNLTLDYKFKNIEGLSAKYMYGFFNRDLFEKAWRKLYHVYTYDQLNDKYNVAGSGKWTPTSLYENYTPFQRSTLLGQLMYEKLFQQKHNIGATLVYEARHTKNDNLNGNKYFKLDVVDQLFAGVAENATISSANIEEYANQSLIGRFNYDFLSKYLIEFGFNYGGSSKFAKGKRWGFFPFTSVGWRISEEEFFKNSFTYVSNLKLRGSIGQMGDDAAANFQFLTGYNYPGGTYIFDNNVVRGLGFRGMPNPNITWFTSTTKNIGVDLDIFEGLFSMQFDVFQRDRSGLLATRILSLPATVGANLPQENLNSDQQKGFEIVIGHRNKINEFTYEVSANLTYTRRKNLYMERATDGNSYLSWRNNNNDRWTDMQWGYEYIGQFQSMDEILNSPIIDGQGNKTLRPGDLKYEDINRDGMINSLDQIPIARSNIPNIFFGLDINLKWKNFDMYVLFQGAADYSFMYQGMNQLPLRWSRNSLTQFMDRWHHEDIYDVNSPLIQGYYPQTGYPSSNTWTSSFWLINGNYMRVKDVKIGYTVINPFLAQLGIQSLRFNVSGFNLFTFSNFKNMDPEQHYREWVFYSYPINKNLGIGLNITF